jgi:hypothetical protein
MKHTPLEWALLCFVLALLVLAGLLWSLYQ